MSASGLLQRLQAHPPNAPLDWRKIREEIHEEHERATTTEERVTLLAIHKAVMDLVERSGIAAEDMEKFKETRLKDYRLLILREALIGENVCAEIFDAVTQREVGAGRMAPDDEFRKTAVVGMAAPHLSRAELIAMDAKQRGRKAIETYWTGNCEVIKDFSDRMVKSQSEKMIDEVIKVATSGDPKMANREKLANLIIEYARFQVLVIDPPPADDPTALRGQPGITGELKAHLFELAEKDKEFREFVHTFHTPKDWDDVWDPVLLRYRMVYAWTHVFNTLRFAFDDVNHPEDKDWFKPFVAAMCAWQEHKYRSVLGMLPSLDDSGVGADLRALMMSGFIDCVMEGIRFPDLEWRDRIQKLERGEGGAT